MPVTTQQACVQINQRLLKFKPGWQRLESELKDDLKFEIAFLITYRVVLTHCDYGQI